MRVIVLKHALVGHRVTGGDANKGRGIKGYGCMFAVEIVESGEDKGG